MKLHHYNEAYAHMVRRKPFANGSEKPTPRTFKDKLNTLKEASRGLDPESTLRLFDFYLQEAIAKGQITEDQASGIYQSLPQAEIKETIETYKRENFAEGTDNPMRYIKEGPDGYRINYSRNILQRKKGPFKTLEEAKKARDKLDIEYDKLKAQKGVVEPAIKKLNNPPDPKKPWRYLRSGSQRGPKKAKRVVEYFATEAEAKAAQTAATKAKFASQTKVPQSVFNKIKARIKKGDTLAEIVKDYKDADEDTLRNFLRKNDTTYSQLTPNVSYIDDKKSLDYIKKNYGKLKGETMGKALYPDLPASTQQSRVRKLVAKLLAEKEITYTPAAMIEEIREEKGFDPETSKKKVRDVRIKKIKKFSVPAFERAMQGDKASQLSHLDDLGSELVRFETLGYSPQRINQEILKNVDPYLNQLYEERAKLLKNKPKGYIDKVNKINDKGAAVAYGTKGYKSFKVEEPITGRTYRLGYDASKTVDPFGQFGSKTIQEVSPKVFRGNIKALEKIIPDPVERYLFIENAKAVQEAQTKVPKVEMDKVAQNLEELGFDTDPYKKKMLNVEGERMTPIEYMLAEESKQKVVPQTKKDKILKNIGKGAKAVGKVIKPLGIGFGVNAVKTAITKAEEQGLNLNFADKVMAFDSGDAEIAINNAKRRVDPKFAAEERAKDLAQMEDDFEEVGQSTFGKYNEQIKNIKLP